MRINATVIKPLIDLLKIKQRFYYIEWDGLILRDLEVVSQNATIVASRFKSRFGNGIMILSSGGFAKCETGVFDSELNRLGYRKLRD